MSEESYREPAQESRVLHLGFASYSAEHQLVVLLVGSVFFAVGTLFLLLADPPSRWVFGGIFVFVGLAAFAFRVWAPRAKYSYRFDWDSNLFEIEGSVGRALTDLTDLDTVDIEDSEMTKVVLAAEPTQTLYYGQRTRAEEVRKLLQRLGEAKKADDWERAKKIVTKQSQVLDC